MVLKRRQIFLYLQESISVKVTPRPSDIPWKFKLAAIRNMNSAHEGEKNHVVNDK